ncbi:thiamine-phosphate kinase [Microbacterium paludicola]|uniref:Thiamine-monophosphate kinase n=1 Tax=Microbacterium paludicola TaxID=300019 RepID=A0A4Y9FYQ0_9MICO|nr:thiamine-phosphate kinase [Microbacterium paludicola]MBF0814804.1 thiamine-phosphate kinase [Microbacterium paludicola]TFU34549.1 thiamine-phosphate kinase [Microbacterium paludicola]
MHQAPADPTIGELSEGEILARIAARTGRAASAIVGPGDDAAVVAALSGSVVATTDTLVHGPDFRLAWSSGYDLGWKAAAVNLADVAAMGARPTALLVALAMPNDTRVSFVEALADGLRDACDALAPGCAVVGGDLTVSATLTVAVTALGDLEGRQAVLRSGAREGDVVAVAGELGVAARGLSVLFDRFRDASGSPVPVDPARLGAGEADILRGQLRPSPPIGLGPMAATAGAHAMMDVSDGLGLDARRMADASDVTIDLMAATLGPDVVSAIEGGEDHALLATFADDVLPPGFRAIGRVVARGEAPLLVDGRPYAGPGGWDPYRDWDSVSG